MGTGGAPQVAAATPKGRGAPEGTHTRASAPRSGTRSPPQPETLRDQVPRLTTEANKNPPGSDKSPPRSLSDFVRGGLAFKAPQPPLHPAELHRAPGSDRPSPGGARPSRAARGRGRPRLTPGPRWSVGGSGPTDSGDFLLCLNPLFEFSSPAAAVSSSLAEKRGCAALPLRCISLLRRAEEPYFTCDLGTKRRQCLVFPGTLCSHPINHSLVLHLRLCVSAPGLSLQSVPSPLPISGIRI